MTDTCISYPRGDLTFTGVILGVHAMAGCANAVVVTTDHSCFHPVDPRWRDQRGDQGQLFVQDRGFNVLDTVVVTVPKTGEPARVDREIEVKRGDDSVYWRVGHVVAGRLEELAACGLQCHAQVRGAVDHVLRRHLSRSHSACHLAALALNTATHRLWRKPVATDSLQHWDFDQTVIARSEILEDGSLDVYRIGKSAKKAGLAVDCVVTELEQIAREINALLQHWLRVGSAISVTPACGKVMDRRLWSTQLDGQRAVLPCGGTHAQSLAELGPVRVSLTRGPAEPELSMRTTIERMGSE